MIVKQFAQESNDSQAVCSGVKWSSSSLLRSQMIVKHFAQESNDSQAVYKSNQNINQVGLHKSRCKIKSKNPQTQYTSTKIR